MNTWTPYYKIDPTERRLVRSNMLYTPLVNPEGNIFCMNWDAHNEYQTRHGPRDHFTEELIDFFFQREIKYLEVFSKFTWAPKILDIKDKKVFIEWPGETCNNIVYSDRSLTDFCSDWQNQLHTIITDIIDAGYYKLSLYPHCHFIDNGILRPFDFYGCVEKNNPYISLDKIKGMIGPNSQGRFDEAVTDGIVNLEILFKRALEHYIVWPDNSLQHLFKQLF